MQTPLLTERTHLFCPSIKVAVVVNIEGAVSFAMLESAIRQAVAANEILCSTIGLDSDGTAYYRPTEKPLYTLSRSDEMWETLVATAHRKPCNLEEGPLLDCFVVQTEPDLQLLLVAHHLVGDGLSMALFVQDIMKALAGSPLVFKPLSLLSSDSVGDSRNLNPVMRFLLDRQNRSWRKTGKAFSYADYQRMVHSYWTDRGIHIASQNMHGETLEKLLHFAKAHKLTLNSIISTAMFKVKGEKAKLGIAASVRPEGYQGMGNYASGISVQYSYKSSKDFTENAQTIQRLIQKKTHSDDAKYFLLRFLQALDPTLIDAAYFAAYDGYDNPIAKRMQSMFGYHGKPTQIGLSNLMVLPIGAQYGPYRLSRFCFIPPLVPNNDTIVGVATLGMSMELSLIGSQRVSLNETQTTLERVVHELMDLVRGDWSS